jgi:multidrug efflux pump subunit AcrA (membrane-fusion protein)
MNAIVTEIEGRRISTDIESQMTPTTTTLRPRKPGVKAWAVSLIALGAVAGGVIVGPQISSPAAPPAAAALPPSVAVSAPLQRDVAGRLEFLGQFSAVQRVELRPQVGGTLTQIGFKDGDIVHNGDLLFQIDPTPYQIKLSEAQPRSKAPMRASAWRTRADPRNLAEADRRRYRQNADQKAPSSAAQAALDDALAAVRDAQFDSTAPASRRLSRAAPAPTWSRSATSSQAAARAQAPPPCLPRSSQPTRST